MTGHLLELPEVAEPGLTNTRCECEEFSLGPGGPRLPAHHRGRFLGEPPGDNCPCDQVARYLVRLRHHNRCDGEVVRFLCERCLTSTQVWIALFVPKCPAPPCGCRLTLDPVGPVMPL